LQHLFLGQFKWLVKVNEIKYEGAHAPVEINDDIFEDITQGDTEPQKVFNFEVEGWHTYFVGWLGALVHNGAKGICIKAALKESFEQLGKKLPCFPAGTLVNTVNGKIAIEDIIIGTEVWAYDLITNKKVLKQVSKTYNNFTKRLVNITFEDYSIQTVTCLHRYWVVDKQAWIEADRLRPKMILLNDNGKYIEIKETNIDDVNVIPTYNFEVEDVHNYFVGDAVTLVHNGNPSIFGSTKTGQAEIYKIIDKTTNEVVYVGKTVQEGGKRFGQHVLEKGLDTERFIKETIESGKWTAYETAVREQHFINKYGTKTKKIVGEFAHVFNKINAISEKKFLKFFDLHKLC
jgi:Pretoxin HINT domain